MTTETESKPGGNRFIAFLTQFYAPLFDNRLKGFHFFYGFPKDNKVFDLVAGFIGFCVASSPLYLPEWPVEPLTLFLYFVAVLFWATFLLAEIFGRKRKFTVAGALLGFLLLAQYAINLLATGGATF